MRNYYVKGEWNAICSRCSLKYKSSQLRKEWTGLYVCTHCWEPRHPQTLIKDKEEKTGTPWSNPEPADVFTSVSEFLLTEDGEPIMPESGPEVPLQTE